MPRQCTTDQVFVRGAFVLGLLAILVAGTVLVGWYLHVGWLTGVGTGVAMRANTALAFILAGSALLLCLRPQQTRITKILARGFALVPAIIGALTLSEYLWSCDLHIDQLLVRDPQPPAGIFYPGRMSPMSATAFILLGLSLVLIDVRGLGRLVPAEVLALLTLAISGLALIGYAHDPHGLHDIRVFTQMSIQTALSFVALSIGVLSARPSRGLMRLVSGPRVGSAVARRLLFVAVLLPVVLGWVRILLVKAHIVTPESAVVIFIWCIVVMLAIVILVHAALLNRADEKRIAMEEDIRRRAEHERLLVQEMNHRVRNNLGALIGLITTMQRDTGDIATFAQSISGRVATMAAIHNMLAASRWEPVSLHHIIQVITARHALSVASSASRDINIPARQVPPMAMVVNELFTNSCKYGALSRHTGTVEVDWQPDHNADSSRTRLQFNWKEAGGPEIMVEPKAGTGTRLINGFLRHELHGFICSSYGRNGAEHAITIELDHAI